VSKASSRFATELRGHKITVKRHCPWTLPPSFSSTGKNEEQIKQAGIAWLRSSGSVSPTDMPECLLLDRP